MKRKFILLLVPILIATFLFGCGNSATDKGDETTTGGEKTYTLAISYASFDDYQVEWEKYAREYAEANGLKIITTSADANIEKQVSDIEALMVQKPDAIMVWAIDSDAMVSSVENIYASDIPCILSSYGVNTEKYDLFLYANQILTGKMQADYCIKWVEEHPGEKLNVGYIWGVTAISGAIDRFDGWNDNSAAINENIVLIDEQIANWKTAEAMTITEDWLLAYPEMNCIVCMSDEMALGTIQALKAANVDMDDFVVLGIDGSESAQLELAKGTLDGTVFENRRLSAEIQMQAVIDFLNGVEFENKDYLIQAKQMMTPDNMEEILSNLD